MSRPCNALHPGGLLHCMRPLNHRGDHADIHTKWPRLPRGQANAARSAPTESAVLSALETGRSQADVARALGISKQRVNAIARKAGLKGRPGQPKGPRPETAILAELRRDAEAAGMEPMEYLREAREQRIAIELIVEMISTHPRFGVDSLYKVIADAIGNPVLASRAREAMDRAGVR